MPIFENLTRFVVDEFAGHDHQGVEFYTLIVKATFEWSANGEVRTLAQQQPIVATDLYAGDPATSGPIVPGDYAPYKPMVDLVLTGRIELPAPLHQVDAILEVGRRLRKTVRVFGDRIWTKGFIKELSLTRVGPFSEMPIEWERSFGGLDPNYPDLFESRNPVGRGLKRKAKALEGQLAPNFENPRSLMTSWDSRPAPTGFGAIAPFWQPRVAYAGTYDEKWQDVRFPLLPIDFDERYFNCAPQDQQFPEYVAGEHIGLYEMTRGQRERFALPEFQVPVLLLLSRGHSATDVVTPDTILIEPALRRLVLIGRIKYFPQPDLTAIRRVLVGEPSKGRLRALKSGKKYIQLGGRP